jgi:hypothetical protein
MKKQNKIQQVRVFHNRTKRNKRRKFTHQTIRLRMLNSYNTNYKIYAKSESKVVKNHEFKFLGSILTLHKWPTGNIKNNAIVFPEICEFETDKNYAEQIAGDILYLLTSKQYNKCILDFSNTLRMSQEFAMLISSIVHYYRMDERALNKRLTKTRLNVMFDIKNSPEDSVNKEIFMMNLSEKISISNKEKDTMHPGESTGIIINDSRKRDLYVNEKARTAKKINNLVNQSLFVHGLGMPKELDSLIQLMISEILDNCEQHSAIRHYFCTANFMTQVNNENISEKVGELNIVFMNLGYSFYEGFLNKREKNIDNYKEVEEFVDYINQGTDLTEDQKETQFVYGILQSGNSRLKYGDQSRGNGTVNFIQMFSELGDFENIPKNIIPKLYILTGKTIVKVCNRNKPFKRKGRLFLPMHDHGEEEWMSKTDEQYLWHGKNNIPGTILSARLYVNFDHLLNKATQK